METETYIVSGSGWCEAVEVNEQIFDTPASALIEAGTRAIEKFVRAEEREVGIVTHVYKLEDIKNPDKHTWLPTYMLLNNASMFKEAERFRSIVLKKSGIDVKTDLKKKRKE